MVKCSAISGTRHLNGFNFSDIDKRTVKNEISNLNTKNASQKAHIPIKIL